MRMRYFIASCLGSPDERSDIRVVLSRMSLALMRVLALCLPLVHVPIRRLRQRRLTFQKSPH